MWVLYLLGSAVIIYLLRFEYVNRGLLRYHTCSGVDYFDVRQYRLVLFPRVSWFCCDYPSYDYNTRKHLDFKRLKSEMREAHTLKNFAPYQEGYFVDGTREAVVERRRRVAVAEHKRYTTRDKH